MDLAAELSTYIVAVSGGVDSVVLLDILRRNPDHQLVVAHFDHGIRDDSAEDRKLVQKLAEDYDLTFVYDEGNLGTGVSEATAREARYKFLHQVRETIDAKAIITAHHQDDLVETAIINMIRGTGRRGLSSLASTESIYRPMLGVRKEDIRKYATDNNLVWREDSTNQDTKYLRNYVRHNVIPKMTTEHRQQFIEDIAKIKDINAEIDNHVETHLESQPANDKLNRDWLIMLPHNVSKEVMHSWLRKHQVEGLDKKQIERLVVIAKTSQPNRIADIDKNRNLRITDKELHIVNR